LEKDPARGAVVSDHLMIEHSGQTKSVIHAPEETGGSLEKGGGRGGVMESGEDL